MNREGAARAGEASGLRVPAGWAVAVLAFVNVIDVRVANASLVVGPVAVAGLLVLARWAGLSWHKLGLGAGTWLRGLAWTGVAIGAVAVIFAVGAALPLTRGAFRDSRYDLAWPAALLKAFVLIPLSTILLAEAAFRGVLWGMVTGAFVTWPLSSRTAGSWMT